jgi:sugar lactone lactonase YvrE
MPICSRRSSTARIHWTNAVLALALLSGCAGTPKPDESGALFYPPPPDLPRLQYLARFSTPSDVEAESMGFRDFIVGKDTLRDHLVRKPYGVALHDGKIYVVDTRGNGYAIFDLKHQRVDLVQGSAGGAMKKPINITVEADGTKYVTDTDRNQILVFDARDKFVRAYGTPDQFKPIDVLVVGDRLYVSDLYHHQIQVLDKTSGKTLFSFGKAGSGEQELFQPTSLALGPDQALYISDSGNFRIQKYSLDGKFMRSYGKVGDSVGHFARPKGIAVDREGRIYIVDAAFENVQTLNNDGTPLMFFGQPGDKRGNINLPTDIIIDYDNLEHFQRYAEPGFKLEYVVLVASQFGINKVVAFGFGKMEGMDYAVPSPGDTQDRK